jgi:hypothetical protein
MCGLRTTKKSLDLADAALLLLKQCYYFDIMIEDIKLCFVNFNTTNLIIITL